MSEYSEISDKINEFELFIKFLIEKHPQIPGEFSEWKNARSKNEARKDDKEI